MIARMRSTRRVAAIVLCAAAASAPRVMGSPDAGSHPGVFSCYRPVPEDTPIPEGQKQLSGKDWSELYRLGMATPVTFSAPTASTAMAAVSAESMPPLKPIITCRKPHLRT